VDIKAEEEFMIEAVPDKRIAFVSINRDPSSLYELENVNGGNLKQDSSNSERQLKVLALACERNETNVNVNRRENPTQNAVSKQESPTCKGVKYPNFNFESPDSSKTSSTNRPLSTAKTQTPSKRNDMKKIVQSPQSTKSPRLTHSNKELATRGTKKVAAQKGKKTERKRKTMKEKTITRKEANQKKPVKRSSPRLAKIPKPTKTEVTGSNATIQGISTPRQTTKKERCNTNSKNSASKTDQAEKAKEIIQTLLGEDSKEHYEEKIRKQVFENAFHHDPQEMRTRFRNLDFAMIPKRNDEAVATRAMDPSDLSCMQASHNIISNRTAGSPPLKKARTQKQGKGKMKNRQATKRKREISSDDSKNDSRSTQGCNPELSPAICEKPMPFSKIQEGSKKESPQKKMRGARSTQTNFQPELAFNFMPRDILVCPRNERSVSKHPGNLAFLRFLLLSFATFSCCHPNVTAIAASMLSHWVHSNPSVRFLERVVICMNNQSIEAWKPMHAVDAVNITVVILRKIQCKWNDDSMQNCV